MKEYYELIFLVLTYKNSNDIIDFITSLSNLQNASHRVVIANSFYNDESSIAIQNIAKTNECDYIEFQNYGYGYGNNRGIEFIKSKYDFEYLVISNPDIVIKKFNYLDLTLFNHDVFAPRIRTLKRKEQNPYYVYHNSLMEYIYYLSYKKNIRILKYFPIAVHKFSRFIVNIIKKSKRIYAAHGSFLIIRKNVLNEIVPLYYEKMFLFAEENYIGRLFKSNKYETLYIPSISVVHKEDGSIGKKNKKTYEYLRQSFITYYEYWSKKKS